MGVGTLRLSYSSSGVNVFWCGYLLLNFAPPCPLDALTVLLPLVP